MLFSQRKMLKPFSKIIQKDSMDHELRNGLWNGFYIGYRVKQHIHVRRLPLSDSGLRTLFNSYWHSYFKKRLDILPYSFEEALESVRQYFFGCSWSEVYDFIEFTLRYGPGEFKDDFIKICNSVLERENSAYRFVGDIITEITSDAEIKSTEEALNSTYSLSGVQGHLCTALEHLSNRKDPDYRNSIKESISAVESLCKKITGDDKATLGKALAVLEKKRNIHPALKKSFSSVYAYTSDADGIRHGMLKEPNLTYNDAKFMLVSCTAFVNYVLGRCAELGVTLK